MSRIGRGVRKAGCGAGMERLEERRLFSGGAAEEMLASGVQPAGVSAPQLRVESPVLRQGWDTLQGDQAIEVYAPDHIGAVVRFNASGRILDRVVNDQGVARLEASVLNPGEYVVSATMQANDVYLGQVRVGIVSENAWRYSDGNSVDPVLWYDRDKSKFFVKYEMPGTAPYQVTDDGMAVRAYNRPVGWRPAGVGDLNGDGHIDLVWQNEGNGAVLVWYMRDGAMVDRMRYLSKGTPWRLAQVRDQDGDGDPDLYFNRDDTTKAAIWHNDDGWFNRVTMKETLMELPMPKPAYVTFVDLDSGSLVAGSYSSLNLV